jgi:hypothetical protein
MRQFKRNLDSEFYNIWREASNNTGTIDRFEMESLNENYINS